MRLKRTHTTAQLPDVEIGSEVVVCGWIHRRRDHGKITFFDIRDRWGLLQVVIVPSECENHELAKDCRSEFVVAIKGIINKRPKGTINPKLITGEIEMLAKDIEILNEAETPPFEIDGDTEPGEDVRLRYRYIDLRQEKLKNNLIAKHRAMQSMRNTLSEMGYIELETPFLTKSTPEGARDYLVPSRVNPGKFYALPQSPQIFKQLFMVAGFDRYFQIARCFRDEDLRADRQPEFTQIDIEASFVDQDDIFKMSEELMKNVFKEVLNIEIKIPFRRMSYEEAVEKYGTDKPDLRQETGDEFSFLWVVDFPLFKYDEEEKRWVSEHHPFTSPNPDDLHLLETEGLDKVRSLSYDLVVNGNELGSGSIRIHNPQLQEKIFSILKLAKEEIDRKFGFLIQAFKYGAPPHGGIAFGLDRLTAIMQGEDSIRDVIAFPKTQKAQCLLTNAPSHVSEKQLKELNIKLDI